MIKAVLFDFDGILTLDKTGSVPALKYVSQKLQLDFEHLRRCYYKYNPYLLRGELTHSDIWEDFCRDVGCNIDYSVLTEAFSKPRLDYDMLGLVSELKTKYKTGLITDNKRDRVDILSKLLNFDELFDIVSISADHKSQKTDKAIFTATLNTLGLKDEECIFIDNEPANLVIPKEMGIKAIHFDENVRDFAALKTELNRLLAE